MCIPQPTAQCTMKVGGTAKVLAECNLTYYRISECDGNSSPGSRLGHTYADQLSDLIHPREVC